MKKRHHLDKLVDAIRENDRDQIQTLVRKHGIPLNAELKKWHRSPLSVACAFADKETVKCLLEMGADPNFAHHHCNLPVMATVERFSPDWRAAELVATEILQVLISYGANLHTYRTPEFRQYISPFCWVIYRGRTRLMEFLLHHGFEVEQMDWEAWTPLSLAAAYGHAATVSSLLARGANPDRKRKDHRTPLHAAVVHNLECVEDEVVCDEAHLAVIRVLLGKGASPRESDGTETILETAQRRGNPELITTIENSLLLA